MAFHESFWVAEAAVLPVIALGQALSMPIATKLGGTPITNNPRPLLPFNFWTAWVIMGYHLVATLAVAALLGGSLASLAESKDEVGPTFTVWVTSTYLALTLIIGMILQLIVWQEKERGGGVPE